MDQQHSGASGDRYVRNDEPQSVMKATNNLKGERPAVTTMRWVVHNVIAHPLLIFCPPLGRWLHDVTAPPDVVLADEAQAHTDLGTGAP